MFVARLPGYVDADGFIWLYIAVDRVISKSAVIEQAYDAVSELLFQSLQGC